MPTMTEPTVVESPVETDDDDPYAHLVDKTEATKAYVYGTPITALCGKTWVPSRDPDLFTPCPKCLGLMAQFRQFLEGNGEG